MEWTALKEDFDSNFRRIRKADIERIVLSRASDEAVESGNRVELREASSSYTASYYYRIKGQYHELVMQSEKAKKRATAGGSTAGGDVAACRLLFEYCDLLFKVLREQWN
jgi:hypothetical protein